MTEDVTEELERKFVYRIKNRADAPNLIGPLNTHPYIKKAELNYVKLFQSQSITFLETNFPKIVEEILFKTAILPEIQRL